MKKTSKITVGAHTSIAGGLPNSISHALEIDCDCLQIFSRNPRGWAARELDSAEINAFRTAREKSGLWPLVIHAVYLINLAAQEPATLERCRLAFREELERGLALGAEYLVIHPGSSKDAPAEVGVATAIACIREAARGLNLKGAAPKASKAGSNHNLSILIENTAGQGSCIGSNFEEVADIVAGLDDLPVDVCLDTAHTFAAGYDISTEAGLKTTVNAINRSFGLDRIKVIHCNDSKVPLGARVDRHEHIGLGHIGDAAFQRITQHSKLGKIPFVLETPIEKERDDRWNINRLRQLSELKVETKKLVKKANG